MATAPRLPDLAACSADEFRSVALDELTRLDQELGLTE